MVTTKEFEGLIVDTLVFRDEILSGRGQEVRKVLQGWFAALDYWKSHKDEADKVMADAYGLKVEEFNDMVSGVRFYDKAMNQNYLGRDDSAPIYKVFDEAVALWKAAGLIQAHEGKAGSACVDSTFLD